MSECEKCENGVAPKGGNEGTTRYVCEFCNGTGEVDHIADASKMVASRSVQRREALQKGEPMPAFNEPKQEMPVCSRCGYPQAQHYNKNHTFVVEVAKPNQEMPERIWAMDETFEWFVAQPTKATMGIEPNPMAEYLRSDLALPRDKVRELVEQFYKVRDSAYLSHSHKEELEKFYNIIAALFPSGVEEEG